MTLVTLPNLYCTPSDCYDYLSSESVQLRLDDHNEATGQILRATADAAKDATSISICALNRPLIAGTVLNFDGGAMPAAIDVILAQTARTGATTLTVNALTAAVNNQSQARDSGVNLALAQRLVKATQYATAQIKLYCCGRYNDSDLATVWSVNRWASVIAGRWVCKRCTRACPKGVQEDFEEVMEELKMVQIGMLNIEDIGTRTAGWPFLSNVTVDPAYDYARVRVEPQLSEPTPTQFPQMIAWNSILSLEYF